MTYQQQTIQERFGAPPPMKEKARLRECGLCKEKTGKSIYLYWGDTGVPKKNDPGKNIVLPVEHESGRWHECPFREEWKPKEQSQTQPDNINPPVNKQQAVGSGGTAGTVNLTALEDLLRIQTAEIKVVSAGVSLMVQYLENIAESKKDHAIHAQRDDDVLLQLGRIGDLLEVMTKNSGSLGMARADTEAPNPDTVTNVTGPHLHLGKGKTLNDEMNLDQEEALEAEADFEKYKAERNLE